MRQGLPERDRRSGVDCPHRRVAGWSNPLFRVSALAVLCVGLSAGAVQADEWLVYIGGGIEAIEGNWREDRGQVIFTQLGGTLVSIPYEELDLAASTFITWQLNGRRRLPPRPDLAELEVDTEGVEAAECVEARVLGLRGGETLEVLVGDQRETIHAACLDAPETEHRFPELGWFGRATVSAIQLEMKPGATVCLTEHWPPHRDSSGHRIVFLTLDDGRDYTGKVIASGLGLLRSELCNRAAEYRELEDRAIAEQRGLWGAMSSRAAISAATKFASKAGGVGGSAQARGPGGGCRRRR